MLRETSEKTLIRMSSGKRRAEIASVPYESSEGYPTKDSVKDFGLTFQLSKARQAHQNDSRGTYEDHFQHQFSDQNLLQEQREQSGTDAASLADEVDIQRQRNYDRLVATQEHANVGPQPMQASLFKQMRGKTSTEQLLFPLQTGTTPKKTDMYSNSLQKYKRAQIQFSKPFGKEKKQILAPRKSAEDNGKKGRKPMPMFKSATNRVEYFRSPFSPSLRQGLSSQRATFKLDDAVGLSLTQSEAETLRIKKSKLATSKLELMGEREGAPGEQIENLSELLMAKRQEMQLLKMRSSQLQQMRLDDGLEVDPDSRLAIQHVDSNDSNAYQVAKPALSTLSHIDVHSQPQNLMFGSSRHPVLERRMTDLQPAVSKSPIAHIYYSGQRSSLPNNPFENKSNRQKKPECVLTPPLEYQGSFASKHALSTAMSAGRPAVTKKASWRHEKSTADQPVRFNSDTLSVERLQQLQRSNPRLMTTERRQTKKSNLSAAIATPVEAESTQRRTTQYSGRQAPVPAFELTSVNQLNEISEDDSEMRLQALQVQKAATAGGKHPHRRLVKVRHQLSERPLQAKPTVLKSPGHTTQTLQDLQIEPPVLVTSPKTAQTVRHQTGARQESPFAGGSRKPANVQNKTARQFFYMQNQTQPYVPAGRAKQSASLGPETPATFQTRKERPSSHYFKQQGRSKSKKTKQLVLRSRSGQQFIEGQEHLNPASAQGGARMATALDYDQKNLGLQLQSLLDNIGPSLRRQLLQNLVRQEEADALGAFKNSQ